MKVGDIDFFWMLLHAPEATFIAIKYKSRVLFQSTLPSYP